MTPMAEMRAAARPASLGAIQAGKAALDRFAESRRSGEPPPYAAPR